MTKEKSEVLEAKDTGVCRFCGTGEGVPLSERDNPDFDADEWATGKCNCNEAWKYRMEKERQERRYKALEDANEQIHELFGHGESHLLDFLEIIPGYVFDGDIREVSINIDGRTKAKIAVSTKSNFVISRCDTEVQKMEV